eukprot:44192-Pelagomonas_calceolata.AAC.1
MNKSRFVKWHGETVQKGSASGPNQHAAAGESAANEQVLPFEGEGYTEVCGFVLESQHSTANFGDDPYLRRVLVSGWDDTEG